MSKQDQQLLSDIASAWGHVQKENKDQRNLVTKAEWEGWVDFDAVTAKKIGEIIDEYDTSLSEENRTYLNGLLTSIGTVKHLNKEELIERKQEEELAAHKAEEARIAKRSEEARIAEEKKQLSGFKKGLSKLFNR